MTDSIELPGIAARLYETALDPSRWSPVLDDFAGVCNAAGWTLISEDTHSKEFHIQQYSSFFTPEFIRDYNARFQEHEIDGFRKLLGFPAQQIFSDREVIRPDLDDYPPICALRESFGVAHRAAARLNTDGAWFGILALQHTEAHGKITAEEAAKANFLLPHITKAVELSRPFVILKNRFNAVVAALDRFHLGVVILTPGGEAVVSNREAERVFTTADGLVLDHRNMPRPVAEAARAPFAEAFTAAVATARAEGSRSGTLLTVPKRGGGDPYLVEVSPLRDEGIELEPGYRGAVMFIVDPARTDIVSTENMAMLYQLTGAESEICRLVAEGLETDEVAEARNVSPETVRTHVKRILSKTGTTSRAQLVRLAHIVNLPIDRPKDGNAQP